jgi:hypothetical protein
MSQRFITALHEAGHATVAIARGCRVSQLSIDGGGSARILYPVDDDQPARYHKQRALVCLAGFAAEQVYYFGNLPEVRDNVLRAAQKGDSADFAQHRVSAAAVGRLSGPMRYSKEEVSGASVDAVLGIIREKWPVVNEIAYHLERLGKLSGEGAAMLYDEGSRDPMDILA